MALSNKVATIFGGTGFVGEQIVRELAKLDYTVKVASRTPEKAYFLRPAGVVGQIVPVAYDPADPDSIKEIIKGSDCVFNCVGLLYEKGKATFQKAHFPNASILRPSLVFGPDDSFFNMFASMALFLPALPLIGGGKTKFQPVYVGDVADAAIRTITHPAYGGTNPQGRIYELGGPEIVTFEEIYDRLFSVINRKRLKFPLPWGLAKLQAGIMSILPNPPLTPDQVVSLKTDNVVSDEAYKLEDLEIEPTGMSLILPTYLNRFRPGGRGKILQDKVSS